MPRSHRLSKRLAHWFLALALAACADDKQTAIDEATRQIERGDFEKATAAIADTSGPLADELRGRIDAGLKHRSELEQKLRVIADDAKQHDANWARLESGYLLRDEKDPRNQERILQFQLDLTRKAAAPDTKPAPGTGIKSVRRATAGSAGAGGSAATDAGPVGAAALAEARSEQRDKLWRTALALAIRAEQDPTSAKDAQLVHESILGAARSDAEAVLARARELEGSGSAVQGAQFLDKELERFPELDEFKSLRFELELMSERAAAASPAVVAHAPRRAAARAPVAQVAPGLDAELARAGSPDECEALAKWRTKAGDLQAAREAWLEAGRRRPTSPWSDECERAARNLEWRIALREELLDFARVDEATALVLGTKAVADDGERRRFESVPLAEIARLIERDHLSSKARLGFIVESLVRGDEREREQALPGLGACVERREIDPAHASSLVALAKGEIADGGWSFRGGHWIEGKLAKAEALADEQSARNAKYAQLIGEFCRSNGVERDSALEQIRAAGDSALLKDALSKRWQEDWERLEKNPNLRQIAALAADRRALDGARQKALALIFDEERYFYPYNPPECPPEKAAKYPAVQREVDELVQAVHAIWDDSKRVKIGDALRQQLAAAAWTSERAAKFDVELAAIDPALRFSQVLPAGGDVGLNDFAWDASERAALTESDRIEARNEKLWSAYERAKPADEVPNSDEQRQVRITNAYRRMLGRRALAWNPKIEVAAQGHSDHMANTGDFSHFEEGDPARRTPFDRLRLAGYPQGVSENITMGRGDPQSAHEGWTHSSGHHRNLLAEGHREMASAIASSYWTQNFGVDTSFLADL